MKLTANVGTPSSNLSEPSDDFPITDGMVITREFHATLQKSVTVNTLLVVCLDVETLGRDRCYRCGSDRHQRQVIRHLLITGLLFHRFDEIIVRARRYEAPMVKRVADRIVIDILKDAIRDVSCHILIPETQRVSWKSLIGKNLDCASSNNFQENVQLVLRSHYREMETS